MNDLSYNERSWAIDLISAIGQYSSVKPLAIRRAGGEHTLKAGEGLGKHLFPDVLLFGDDEGIRVRHGWELKFPDTPIDDSELILNATEKAQRLRVNSFLLWNVDRAVLYVQKEEAGTFEAVKAWGPLGVADRASVKGSEAAWRLLLREILDDINEFFARGELKSASPTELFDETFFSGFINEYVGVATSAVQESAQKSGKIEAQYLAWWKLNAGSFGSDEKRPINYRIAATSEIVNWINRFVFTHYLKQFRSEASDIEKIRDDISISDARDVFSGITAKCNFMQIFAIDESAMHIGEEAWEGLKQLNAFLSDLTLDGIPQSTLRTALEQTVVATQRKGFGQFTTPDKLADLLVVLAVEKRHGNVLDPCCGTGTIAKSAYRLKRAKGQSPADALRTTWASDKFRLPLQLCTISLAEPEAIWNVVQVFESDVFDLIQGNRIELIDPSDGSMVERELPRFDTIVSNLPFVRFETIAQFNPGAREAVSDRLSGKALDGRTDLFGYILVFLESLVNDEGQIGLIVSNSWLGSMWGIELRARLADVFHVETVVTSGSGRWFSNADVVGNLIILSRKGASSGRTSFITTRRRLDEWDTDFIERVFIADRSKKNHSDDDLNVRVYAQKDVDEIEKVIVGWSAFFADVSWVKSISNFLVSASDYLEIGRGYRKGWNDMFYPDPRSVAEYGIEDDYLKPVLKDVRGFTTWEAKVEKADGESVVHGFSCSVEEHELDPSSGALRWIKRFADMPNGQGVPLREVMKSKSRPWYEMRLDKRADLVLSMNPDRRIWIMRLSAPTFVDQRLISLAARKPTSDVALIHALLNSSLGLFMIEASGFGRGLGVLDLDATKIRDGLYMFDPEKVSEEHRTSILKAFETIKGRDVLPIEAEMVADDRKAFDAAVLDAFGVSEIGPAIRRSLLEIYRIRQSVKLESEPILGDA